MRVISGSLSGLRLDSLPGLNTRPTLDRVKEALFSMLFDKSVDSVGLDLFAGSGALGIELLSRYGKECTFVDASQDAIGIINTNIKKGRLADRACVEHMDALEFLKTTEKKFDIIFMDPPYASALYEDALNLIKKRNILSASGVVICECDADFNFQCQGYDIIKDKTYGKVRLVVLEEAKQK